MLNWGPLLSFVVPLETGLQQVQLVEWELLYEWIDFSVIKNFCWQSLLKVSFLFLWWIIF